jgi:hypothetical protein
MTYASRMRYVGRTEIMLEAIIEEKSYRRS